MPYRKVKGLECQSNYRQDSLLPLSFSCVDVDSNLFLHFCPFSLLWHSISNSVLILNPSSLHSQLEVFNILFIREQEKRHVVHCMGCARKQQPTLQGFVCLEEYKLSELVQVYDSFVLHKPPPPIAVPAPPAATGTTPTTPSTTGAPQSTTTSATTSPTVTTSASTTSVTN